MHTPRSSWLIAALIVSSGVTAAPIDRHALVTRHNPTITAVDKSAPFMVGNGNFAFTADITGLQTFQDQYSPLTPLLIEAQWGWHSFPNPKGFKLAQAMKPLDVYGKKRPYPALFNWDEAKQDHIQWLRENPHKFSLGRLALRLETADGKAAAFTDLSATQQTLDLWSGRLTSSFTFEGAPVQVETSVHPERDLLIVRLKSPLLFDGRLGVDLKFPGVSHQLNPDPADWDHPEAHSTQAFGRGPGGMTLTRTIDDTRYSVKVASDRELDIETPAAHAYRMTAPGSTQLTLLVEFTEGPAAATLPEAEAARTAVAKWWEGFWMNGGAVDLTGSKHPGARELERRIVLSQYLTAVNSAGLYPPQEEGLFSNSWNGKFHLEMHAWHAAHFAVWGRPQLLERSMPWYLAHLDEAKARAKDDGRQGRVVAQDGRAGRAREPQHRESLHHVAAAASYLPGRDAVQRAQGPGDAREIQEPGVRDRRAARHLAALRQGGGALHPRAAHDPGAGEFRSAENLQSHLRAGVFPLRHRHRAGLARATRPAQGPEVGQRAVPACPSCRRRMASISRPSRSRICGNARVRRNVPRAIRRKPARTAITPRSSPRTACCRAGVPTARPCGAP